MSNDEENPYKSPHAEASSNSRTNLVDPQELAKLDIARIASEIEEYWISFFFLGCFTLGLSSLYVVPWTWRRLRRWKAVFAKYPDLFVKKKGSKAFTQRIYTAHLKLMFTLLIGCLGIAVSSLILCVAYDLKFGKWTMHPFGT